MPKTPTVLLRNGTVPSEGSRVRRDLLLVDGRIAEDGADAGGSAVEIDAEGLLVLPGLVDIHGDAFERQIMPRPGVSFDLDLALDDTDRQLAANGITTAFHGVTCSWEPGLRGVATVRRLIRAIASRRDGRVDGRVHLRHETFNLEAEAETV
jgi:alpha-D-ribose 1-methylphosphonate 5-triphosphate diphosphatase